MIPILLLGNDSAAWNEPCGLASGADSVHTLTVHGGNGVVPPLLDQRVVLRGRQSQIRRPVEHHRSTPGVYHPRTGRLGGVAVLP
jgi:hypothetical protein